MNDFEDDEEGALILVGVLFVLMVVGIIILLFVR